MDGADVATPPPRWMTTPVGAGPRACPPYDDAPGRHDPYDAIVVTRSPRRDRRNVIAVPRSSYRDRRTAIAVPWSSRRGRHIVSDGNFDMFLGSFIVW